MTGIVDRELERMREEHYTKRLLSLVQIARALEHHCEAMYADLDAAWTASEAADAYEQWRRDRLG